MQGSNIPLLRIANFRNDINISVPDPLFGLKDRTCVMETHSFRRWNPHAYQYPWRVSSNPESRELIAWRSMLFTSYGRWKNIPLRLAREGINEYWYFGFDHPSIRLASIRGLFLHSFAGSLDSGRCIPQSHARKWSKLGECCSMPLDAWRSSILVPSRPNKLYYPWLWRMLFKFPEYA